VALDESGRPRPVPAWTPETETDRALQRYALRLVELRKLMDSEMEASLGLLEQSGA
jgi:acyl-CoA hydrolase